MEFHEIANVFPLIEGAEFKELVADIAANGLREPVILLDGKILDGRNRYRACVEAGIEPRSVEYSGTDPVAFVVSLNLRRRHLSEGQRAWVAAQIANLDHGQKKADSAIALSQPEAAAMLNVSVDSVKRAKVVRDRGAPELQAAVATGQVAVSVAADVARLPGAEQREIVARGEGQILEAAAVAAVEAQMPEGKFGTIVIDPPWPMQKIERDARPNQVAFEYPTMTEDELVAFGDRVNDAAADDCHLFMWTTQKFLPMSLRLLDAWGFRYVLTMVWHKPGGFQPIGLPQYNCEFCIYARRGAPAFVDTKQFATCFDAPRREHSRKPDEFYETVRRVTVGPRIDIFSREERDGFEQFGNEVARFEGAA
jgi:N6-adenosine-specific RNA methylase IME4